MSRARLLRRLSGRPDDLLDDLRNKKGGAVVTDGPA